MLRPLDAMRAAIIRHYPEAIGDFREAAIFDLEGEATTAAYMEWARDRLDLTDEWLDEFFMPFPTVVVLLDNCATMLTRSASVRGLWVGDDAPEPDSDGFTANITSERSIRRLSATNDADSKRYIVSDGYAHGWLKNAKGQMVFRAAESTVTVVTRSGNVLHKLIWESMHRENQEATEELAGIVRSNTAIVLRRLWWALQPSHWIVKKSPEMAGVVRRGSLPLDHQRERHIVMSQREIERMFRVPNPENTGRTLKVGHRRRACWHTLKHERFGERRGQRVFVSGCWVGPEEVSIGGERYKVLLDAPGWSPNDLPDLPDGTIEL